MAGTEPGLNGTSHSRPRRPDLSLMDWLCSPWVLGFAWFAVLGLGLLWIWLPILDGVSEIYNPGVATWDMFFADLLAPVMALPALVFYSTLFSLASYRKRSAKYLVYMVLPIVVLIAVNRVVYPPGMTRIQKRWDSLLVGARAAIKRAGGDAVVRREALALLASKSETAPSLPDWAHSLPASQWPGVLYTLRPMSIQVDKKAQWVDVQIMKRPCFGNRYGYLVMDKDADEPVIADSHGYRYPVWKIADGIYLYEKP